MKRVYQQCSQCVLDTNDDENIAFDVDGVCTHCHYYKKQEKLLVKLGSEGDEIMNNKIAEIKECGKGKKYDCLIGISGGVDSSYVSYLAYKNGLRALCVHFDNGWNSELAVMNIENIVNKLGFDLYTYVINWEEFKDLQLAYLYASVVDIEVLTDHAIYTSMFKIAKKNDIKYVLGGLNVVTEGILPYNWTYNKKDFINIKAIHKLFGKKQLKTFPFLDQKMKRSIKKYNIQFINYLDWIEYDKNEAKKTMSKAFNWRDYGGKHFESVWTRFYQAYILPTKFKIDKRKAHLSTLICSGQITREQALEEMKHLPYTESQLRSDMEFVLKKLDLNREEFDKIMALPIRDHREFDTEGSFFSYYPFFKFLKPFWEKFKFVVKGIRGKKERSNETA